MKFLMALILTVGFASTAAAKVQPTGCVLSDIHVKSTSLILITKGSGEAVITCNGSEPKAVSIDITSVGLGLGQFELWGGNVSLGIANPYDLNGSYAVLEGTAGVVLSVGANVGLRGDNGLNFTFGIKGGKGLGAAVTFGEWKMTVLN